MIRTSRFALFLLALSSAWAQQLPDGSALMKQSQEAIKSLHSLQFVSTGMMEMGAMMKMQVQVSTAMVRPDKSRSEINMQGMTMLTVCDGNTTWVYNSTAKQYVRKSAALGAGAILSAIGIPNMPDVSKIQTTEKTIGQETVEVDGKKHDCWIVESRMPEMDLPGAKGAKMTDSVTTLWIDKKLLVDLKSQMNMKVNMVAGAGAMEVHMTSTKKDLKVDEPVPDSMFEFTPPADAKEVDSIMGGAMSKSELTGKPAPAFEVKALDGKTYSLASLKGKPVLLDFWATWCGPCRQSLPVLEKIYATYKDQDLIVIGINVGEERDTVNEFLKTSHMSYPVALSDPAVVTAYGVSAFPTFVMIGRDGNVVGHEIGFSEDLLLLTAEKAGFKRPKE